MKKTHFNIVEKNGKVFVIDLDGKVMPPEKARQIAHGLISTTEAPSYVYIGQRDSDKLYKIGKTGNLRQRSSRLGIQFEHRIICTVYGKYASSKVEAALHRFFKAAGQHVEDEWFDLGDKGFSLITTYCHDAQTTLAFVDEYLPHVQRLMTMISRYGLSVLAVVAAQFISKRDKDPALWKMFIYLLTKRSELPSRDAYVDGYLEGIQNVLGSVNIVRQGGVENLLEQLEQSQNEAEDPVVTEGED